MSDQHDIDAPAARESVDKLIRSAQKLALRTAGAEPYDSPIAIGDDGVYALIEDGGASERAVLSDPAVSFSASSEDSTLSGSGRAILHKLVGEVPEIAALFKQAGVAADAADRVVKIVPHEVTIDGAEGTQTCAFPYGGETKSTAGLWWQAVRPFAYTASVTPILLGAVLAWFLSPGDVAWWLLPIVVIAGVLYHTGANLVSDYFDYTRRVDRMGTMGSSGILVNGLMAPRTILLGGIVAFAIGTALGLWMVSMRGMPLLWIGLAGLVGGFFYSGWPLELKYRGLGEVVIFALFGPLMAIGAYIVLTGVYSPDVLVISLPVGFLVAAIVQANNLRDIADDAAAGVTTISNAFGQKFAAIEYYAMIVAAYVSVVVMIALGTLPVWTLIVALSIPPAAKIIKLIQSSHGKHTAQLAMIDQMSAQVHLLFGLLLMVGLVIGKLV